MLALIRQPVVGWSSVEVWGPGIAGIVLLGIFVLTNIGLPAPMLPLGLFRRRNFAIGNLETFAMYGGLGATFFFLVLFLQQVAGYDALQAGLALLPATLMMFALSKRAGRLADRFGPRLFMGVGPLVAAFGLGLMLRINAHLDYVTDLLPALLVFSLGLAVTVAPLTATVLAEADESNAGIASGVNNAIARVAGCSRSRRRRGGLGAVQLGPRSQPRRRALTHQPGRRRAGAQGKTLASVDPVRDRHCRRGRCRVGVTSAFHVGIGIATLLVAPAACSAWPGSATRVAPSAARTARAGSSRASRSIRPASGRRRSRLRRRLGLANLQQPSLRGLAGGDPALEELDLLGRPGAVAGHAPCLDGAENRVRMPADVVVDQRSKAERIEV